MKIINTGLSLVLHVSSQSETEKNGSLIYVMPVCFTPLFSNSLACEYSVCFLSMPGTGIYLDFDGL